MNTFQSSKAYRSRIPGESVLDRDDESDRAILEDEENKGLGIMKTTQVTVREQGENLGPSQKSSQASYDGSPDWSMPTLEKGVHHAR